MADLASTRIFGKLTVMHEAIVKANATIVGKIVTGDRVDHPNISNVLNYNSSVGVTAYRPFNLIDSSGVIKVVRVSNKISDGAGIEAIQCDDTLENVLSRSFFLAEEGHMKFKQLSQGGSIIFENDGNEAMRIDPNGNVGVAGNVTAEKFIGDGSQLTALPWGQLTGKPTTATRWPSWNEVSSKPSTFAPSSHSHAAGDLPNASTSARGVVQLNNSTSSTSTVQAATANAVKTANDAASSANSNANSRVAKSGDTMTNKLTIDNSNYRAHLDLKRGSNVAQINPSTGSNSGATPELRFEGDMAGYWFDGKVKAEDGFFGDGSGLTGTASLRATGTTKGDVGLGNVTNAAQVTISGDQSVSGVKTFTGSIHLNGSNSTPDLVVTRTNAVYNALMRFSTTSETDVFLGQGDSGHFAVGRGTDMRYSNANCVFDVDVANGNIKWKGTASGDGSGLTGTASLRATGTTKGDVGLSGIPNTNGSTSNFLRGDGTWVNPPNTTYSEISTAEIDAGTASTRRTISGRRMKYALDKKSNTGHTHSVADISGLSDAATTTVASIRSGTTKANVGLGNVQNVDQTNASNLSSGTVPIARISSTSSRTSTSTSSLLEAKAMNDHRGSGDHDGRYYTKSESDTRYATTELGGVGSYALLQDRTHTTDTHVEGATRLGSGLHYASTQGTFSGSSSPAGTWRRMGQANSTTLWGHQTHSNRANVPGAATTLWVRIA